MTPGIDVLFAATQGWITAAVVAFLGPGWIAGPLWARARSRTDEPPSADRS
ncbi:hypothetical protein [Geodermatophilus sp. TF02-6]|uniref:hypothetical protein n=1 Tax=Geodermatophilus sp. TF02-6 TaxID=2250575 RepID=UPI001314725B|nr:hypothetical protein [Geodermatophilus sp. TF02-6]